MSGTLFPGLAPGFVPTDGEARVAAIEAFLRALTHDDIPAADCYQMLGYNMVVPAHVCGAMLQRSLDNDDVPRRLTIPALNSHGDRDTSVLLEMAEHHAGLIDGAMLSIYAHVGHAPFYERPERFNSELAAFAARCQSG